jgi:transketolase
MIPHLYVVRPADALEVAAAWAIALAHKKGPTAFALSRQKLPAIKRDDGFDPKNALRGLYTVSDAKDPEIVILASGSELQLAVGAKAKLEAEGKRVRVVSALCVELFEKQDAAYKESVLPKNARKVAIEAGRPEPWKILVGEDGLAIGLDRFGASAPDKVLAQKLGFTADAVMEKIKAWL